MLTRRDLLQAAMAAAAISGLPRDAGSQALSRVVRQEDLLRFRAKGQVTLLHLADTHAQLKPIFYREPSINLGVGAANDQPPHVTDRELLARYAIDPGSWRAYALSSADFEVLAHNYGKVGGLDRMATLIKAIRAERGRERTLLIDGGDALQGSYTALQSRGGDMVVALEALGVDVTTGHWEFTLGDKRMSELYGDASRSGVSSVSFLAGNVFDTEFDEPVFKAWRMFEKGGVRIAVIGQAFPYAPIANPRWMMPRWSFGIRESAMRRHVTAARAAGADIVVLNSHNGFDVDRKLAGLVEGIDVILTAHTHDALPTPVTVGRTLLIASGSHGKFLSRLDLEVKNRQIVDYAYALIPVLSDSIEPDPDMTRVITQIREPHEAMLSTALARTDMLLYRRGNFSGTFDDLICDALMQERDAQLSFSPGFRWGASLMPGQAITWDDIYNATAIPYPAVYRVELSGAAIKSILEDVADNLFNPDPFYQQGGDMVRVGGMGYTINVDAPMGNRISAMTLMADGSAIDPGRIYTVAGWGSVNEAVQGPPVWDLIGRYLMRLGTVATVHTPPVKVVRGGS